MELNTLLRLAKTYQLRRLKKYLDRKIMAGLATWNDIHIILHIEKEISTRRMAATN